MKEEQGGLGHSGLGWMPPNKPGLDKLVSRATSLATLWLLKALRSPCYKPSCTPTPL